MSKRVTEHNRFDSATDPTAIFTPARSLTTTHRHSLAQRQIIDQVELKGEQMDGTRHLAERAAGHSASLTQHIYVAFHVTVGETEALKATATEPSHRRWVEEFHEKLTHLYGQHLMGYLAVAGRNFGTLLADIPAPEPPPPPPPPKPRSLREIIFG